MTNKPLLFVKWVLMCILSLIIFIPLLFIVLNALKNTQEAAVLKLTLPSEWMWSNFSVVFEQGRMLRGLINSSIVTGGSVVLTISIGVLAAFIIARRSGKVMNVIYLIFVAGLIAPSSVIPTFKLMQFFHLNNHFTGVILLYAALNSPFIILMMTGFVKSIPKEIDESAFVDGSHGIGLFVRIILPLLVPSITTALIFVFLGVWNDFQLPLYFLNNSEKWTIPLSVFAFKSKFGSDWNLIFANLIIAMLPILLVYAVGQKLIIDELTAGAIKG
ncbi:carbohydrate ABC transporter permease [Paenibacillus psychroresistens]|uniref:Carbohydrate ABC transporter permease n=1 Tax=Paenibacillus psychroresistens TaxID=1778678 RepID=A0A6B8RVT4_9BACL|nr:carbohydrate ABC transporter permease [Paenibacillus psychroresistens]QGQ99755.1 carbohydrate ABC transporter permease [Paenibacillus psychroresistens]